MRRALLALSLVCSIALLGLGAALAVVPDSLPSRLTEYRTLGVAVAVLALVIALASLGLMPNPTPPPAPVAPAPAPRPVRAAPASNIAWTGSVASKGNDATAKLEELRQKMARLKVQYGLGEMSAETYKTLMGDLQAEETSLIREQAAQEQA